MNKTTNDFSNNQSIPGWNLKFLLLSLVLITGLLYYFSNPKPWFYYDYTFRIAENLLMGKIGLEQQQPSYLNEMIPFEGRFYSAFPFGAVVTFLPVAAIKAAGLIKDNPAGFLVGLIASGICLFLLLISAGYEFSWAKRILLTLAILFGSWMWTNLAMAGAWQLAIGFAMLGQFGAIYFSIIRRNGFLAGCFFALAFGNRTELLLIAPIFMFFLIHDEFQWKQPLSAITNKWKDLTFFCLVPFVLGVATLIYNYLRFHSFMDFGYARIPGVLEEPWYRYGIFALSYIPLNFYEMLVTLWKPLPQFPYFTPTGFGGAIWLSSPFLIFLLRPKVRNKIIWCAAWMAILVLTFLLWTHGNPGGWQYSYRYAMVLLPWIFVILLENSPPKITFSEILLYSISVAINAWATYLFFWTDYVRP